MLRSLFLLLHINDIYDEVKSSLLQFADDAKILRPIVAANDYQILQENLDKLH